MSEVYDSDGFKHFDEVILVESDDGRSVATVCHRNTEGKIFAWHSPLAAGAISCVICESGVRVYV